MNDETIQAIGEFVCVRPIKPTMKSGKHGLVIVENDKHQDTTRGVVVTVPTLWEGHLTPFKVRHTVIYPTNRCHTVRTNNEDLVMVKAKYIMGVVTDGDQ